MTESGTEERVLLAVTCSEKSSPQKDRPSVLLVTQSRLILSPISDSVLRKKNPNPAASFGFPGGRPKGSHTPPHDPFTELLEEYRAREPEEILRTDKDAREIPFEGIADVTFRRVRDTLNHPRWISILLSPYDLGPASARYSVDYQIVITTPAGTHTLLTPFLLELKQVLVDQLGDCVHEIIDSNAPLL
jgi:hypothetical protein